MREEVDDGQGDVFAPPAPDVPDDSRSRWLALIRDTPEWLGQLVYDTVNKAHTVLKVPPRTAPPAWDALLAGQRLAWVAGARAGYEEGYSDGYSAGETAPKGKPRWP